MVDIRGAACVGEWGSDEKNALEVEREVKGKKSLRRPAVTKIRGWERQASEASEVWRRDGRQSSMTDPDIQDRGRRKKIEINGRSKGDDETEEILVGSLRRLRSGQPG